MRKILISSKIMLSRLGKLDLFMIVALGVHLCLLIFAAFKFYSPIPQWDMWNGGIEWYLNRNGVMSFILGHNEHKIILTRILFAVDFKFFGGDESFLVGANYLFLFLIATIFIVYIKNSINSTVRENRVWLIIVTCFALFSWVQSENMTWAFQSQFILVSLLPLLSFYLAQKYLEHKDKRWFLILSGFFAVLSVGTMANGQFAPYILGLIFILNKPKKMLGYILIFAGGLLSFIYYSVGNQAVSQNAGGIAYIAQNPIQAVIYLLAYLGNPIARALGGTYEAKLVAILLGGLFALVATMFIIKFVKEKAGNVTTIMPTAMLVLVGLSALATMSGRLQYGVGQAFSSRYATPVLIGYLCAIILLIGQIKWADFTKYLSFALSMALLVFQFNPTNIDDPSIANRRTAAIAIALDVKDYSATSAVWPWDSQYLVDVAERAETAGITAFSRAPLNYMSSGGTVSAGIKTTCRLTFENAASQIDGSAWSKSTGWVDDLPQQQADGYLAVLDDNAKVLGWLSIQTYSMELHNLALGLKSRSHFEGYINSKIDRVGESQEFRCSYFGSEYR